MGHITTGYAPSRQKMNVKKSNRIRVILIIAVGVLIVISALIIAICKSNRFVVVNSEKLFRQWNEKIIYKGQRYKKNKDISPILFLGVDHADGLDDAVYLGRGGRSDTIYVFLLNKKEKTNTLLSISRDAMTEVDVYNPEGRYYYSGIMQVTMQYAYGNSDKNSSQLAEKTISELLYDLDFDAYLSVNLDAVSDVVDMLGGMTITMPEDYSYIDPRYKKDEELTLDSWEVEWLLRYRDKSQLESNDDRMKRQTVLLETAVEELKARGILSMVSEILDLTKNNITTNAGVETIKKIASFPISKDSYSVPGDNRAGEIHAEFYVDGKALMDLLVKLFYIRLD